MGKYEPQVWRFFYGMRGTVDGSYAGRMQVMSKIIILASKRIKIMTEYEKMLSGEIYNAVDPSLLKDLYACSELCWEYNQIRPTDFKARNEKLKQILGTADDDTFITLHSIVTTGSTLRSAGGSLPTSISSSLTRLQLQSATMSSSGRMSASIRPATARILRNAPRGKNGQNL